MSDFEAVINLYAETWTQNKIGVLEKTETKTQAYARISSVTGTEFHEGGRNGIRPALRMTVFRFDYSGQEIVEYEGTRYTVYRTYMTGNDRIELYVEKRKGDE